MDSTLYHPSRDVDVHMGVGGGDMQCADCHRGAGHTMRGTRYSKGTPDDQLCRECHSTAPHAKSNPALDSHTARVACQTCHIPEYARNNIGTEKSWDWSTATKMGPDGKPVFVKDSAGNLSAYTSREGPSKIVVYKSGVPGTTYGPTVPYSFGSTVWQVSTTFTIDARNGFGTLNLTGSSAVAISGSGVDQFYIDTQPLVAIAPNTTADFIATFITNHSYTTITAVFTITNNDPDNGSFYFQVSGYADC